MNIFSGCTRLQLLPSTILPQLLICQTHLSTSSIAVTDDSFKVIYKWPLIRHFRFIARLKTYQTSVMVLSLPVLTYLYKVEAVTSDSLIGGCVAAGGAVTVLSVLSYAFSRIIGELRYSEMQPNVLQLSHLSFLGNKKSMLVNVEEIVPFGDLHQGNTMNRLAFGNQSFYYSLKYGNVIDPKTLKNVLAIM